MCRINPRVDIVFKKLFGSEENKDLLRSFINSVLPNDEQIKELTVKNPYNLSDYKNGKLSILDIKATDENGKLYDIEMQVGEQFYYGQRALYYWGKTYTGQIDEEGAIYSTLKKTIVISILDFKYFDEDDRYHRAVVAKDRDNNNRYEEIDYFEMHFIELPKFTKELSSVQTTLDRWVTFLTKAHKYEKDSIPNELSDIPEVKKAIEKLDTIYLNKEEAELYEAEQKLKRDIISKIMTAEQKGLQEGIEKGLQEGKIETARNLIELGVEVKKIVEATGISKEEIDKLKEEK